MKFFIDTHDPRYDNNNFFNLNDPFLNRDDGLLPFVRLKNSLEAEGFEVSTFDKAAKLSPEEVKGSYYVSFGRDRDPEQLKSMGLKLYAYIIMEPPLVKNAPYLNLPTLTRYFDNVFIHNTTGDCYPLKDVDTSKLKKLYWPQPHSMVREPFWSNTNRKCEVIMINGHHKPIGFEDRELYSERIKWCVKLNKYIPTNIFGRGWDRVVSRSNIWFLYLVNFFKIRAIYNGPCESKFAEMSKFDFALCFENLSMNGYITEKIFDCFYSGIIPIYWGGDDIKTWIPENTFIDIRKFKTAKLLADYLKSLTAEEKLQYKVNAKNFLENNDSQKYYDLFDSLNLINKPWLSNK